MAAAAIDMALGVTESPAREAGVGWLPEPDEPPEVEEFLTPLQAARRKQNERIPILCRTYSSEESTCTWNEANLFGADRSRSIAGAA